MKCPYCKRKIMEEDRACPYCGTWIGNKNSIPKATGSKKNREIIKKLKEKTVFFIYSTVWHLGGIFFSVGISVFHLFFS